jgi:hypothetical protein
MEQFCSNGVTGTIPNLIGIDKVSKKMWVTSL